METALITHPVMEVEEARERLEGQTPGLVPMRYLEQIRHISTCGGWRVSSRMKPASFNHLIPQLNCALFGRPVLFRSRQRQTITWEQTSAATRKPTRKLHV